MSTDTWDVVVVGGGPAGENAAAYAAEGGLSAVLVEHELLGGECSYWACIPSKALLAPVAVLGHARALPGVVADRLDVGAVLARRDERIDRLDDASQVEWAQSANVDVVRGRGRLVGEREVAVGDRTLRAGHAVVLATGSTASLPPVAGLREAHPWTSRDVTNLHAVPERVAIVGGGVVGCEAATWLIGLGARSVTLVVRGDRLLSRAEPFAGEAVAEGLRAAGVDVRLGTEVERVERGPVIETAVGRPRGAEAVLAVGGEPLAVDEVVVATGRAPSTGDLGLESVGLDPEAPLEVDEHLAVGGSDWLYAVGDVNGLSLLTHMGKYQARICGDAIAARAAARRPPHRDYADGRAVTQVTFTDPQVASVGPTEAQARERLGERVDAIELDISVSGAKLLRDGYSGRAKLVLDRADGTLLGATFVGPDVGELLHAATIAVVGRVTLDRLWHAVPAFPTVSEVWLRLLEALRTR